eukprot:TRINITY_DN1811_c0_g1_i2.p1 TRINITY_DN1811_c0_g1~~TRINITY_DN1811_c0_g1_i2.p1  ORF type:complete len:223 (+),score=38.64 TRINITY_DN1811_c0_g1_i2:154-822(+)
MCIRDSINAEYMGGIIAVKSKPMLGTKFIFSINSNLSNPEHPESSDVRLSHVTSPIPKSSEEEKFNLISSKCIEHKKTESQASSSELKISIPFGEAKVLIVDDEWACGYVIANYCKSFKLQYDLVTSGESALELAREQLQNKKNPYSLVLMDMNMPIMNGLETSQALLKLYNDYKQVTQIIGMSGDTSQEMIDAAAEKGISTLLQKPIQKEVLNKHLRRYFY